MTAEETNLTPAKFEERRRGVRMNSRVPVAVAWDSEGATESAQAHTRVVGPYGCLLVFPRNLPLDQRIRITNLANQQTLPAVVVWKGKERPEGWELGIELVNPPMDFWGLDLLG